MVFLDHLNETHIEKKWHIWRLLMICGTKRGKENLKFYLNEEPLGIQINKNTLFMQYTKYFRGDIITFKDL